MSTSILVVEDEPSIQDLLALTLRHGGYTVQRADDGASAQALLQQALPDLVVLDWMLPDHSGVELAARWRKAERTRDLPIIMLTARGEEEDKIQGLDSGVDDYLTKPFSPKELLARIRALLRRRSPEVSSETLEVAGLGLRPDALEVTAGGQTLRLGATEYRLLHYLAARPNRVFSREKLLNAVWGDHVFIEERTVDVHIRRLRAALEPLNKAAHIETVRGGGYQFVDLRSTESL